MAEATKTPRKFAAGTKVSLTQSQEDIKKTLRKYGATKFAHAEEEHYVALLFVLAADKPSERRVRFTMPMPGVGEFRELKQGFRVVKRTTEETLEAYHAELDRRWRALAMGIKAKLVLVDEGIESIEEAFYANIVLPDNTTIYESTHAGVALAYERGLMPPTLLPALPAPGDEP